MNVSCKVIEDLLPLYHDGVCSGDSRALVEEHLKTCETCGKVKAALDAEETPEAAADDKKALKGIKKKVRRGRFTALFAGIALVLAAALGWQGVEHLTWARACETLYEEVVVPMEPDRMVYQQEDARYDSIRNVTEWFDGAPEYRTDAAYYKTVEGYEFTVNMPGEDMDGRALLWVKPVAARWDWEEEPAYFISLETVYPAESEAGYTYTIVIEDEETGFYVNFELDQSGTILDAEPGGAEYRLREYALETYGEEIEAIIAAAEAGFPHLSE